MHDEINDPAKALLDAVVKNDIETVTRLLNQRANIESSDKDGRSLLYLAAQHGHKKLTIELLNRNANIATCNKNGFSPLHGTTTEEIAFILMERGAEVNRANNDGLTPMHAWAKYGCDISPALLIQYKANIDARDNKNNVPIHLATRYNRPKMVTNLLTHKASVNDAKQDGSVPLHLASKYGCTEAASILIDHKTNVNTTNAKGFTPLMYAAQHGYEALAQMLTGAKADINQNDPKGYTPLYLATKYNKPIIVAYFLKHKANINSVRNGGWTPLLAAAREGYHVLMDTLLERQADINQTLSDGATALYLASQNGHSKAACLLLDHKANINQPLLHEAATPLYIASQNGHTELVATLLEHKAEVGSANSSMEPLYAAVQGNHITLAKCLLDHRANIEAKKPFMGATVLFVAAYLNHTELIGILLEYGANHEALNYMYKTPLDIAQERHNTSATALLLLHHALKTDAANRLITQSESASNTEEHMQWNIMQLLLEQSSPNSTEQYHKPQPSMDTSAYSLLCTVKKHPYWEIIEPLVLPNACVDRQNIKSHALLFAAHTAGKCEIIAALLDRKADPNASQENTTLLHKAAKEKSINTLKVLRDHGVDFMCKDSSGMTAWDLIMRDQPLLNALTLPHLMRVWGGKKMPPGYFLYQPVAPKNIGKTPGFMATTPSGKRWLLRLGWPMEIIDRPDTLTTPQRHDHSRSEITLIKELIAAALYTLLGNQCFYVVKHRLARVIPINAYSEKHPDGNLLSKKLCEDRTYLHLATRWITDIKSLHTLTECKCSKADNKNKSFFQWIKDGIVPTFAIIEGVVVKLLGLVELFAVAKLLGDTDVIGDLGDNTGYIIERKESGAPIAIRMVKIDVSASFNFSDRETNRLLRKIKHISNEHSLVSNKDIQCSNWGPDIIRWKCLSVGQQNRFLTALKNGLCMLKKRRILQLMIQRQGQMIVKDPIHRKPLITEKIVDQFISRFVSYQLLQDDIYTKNLATVSKNLIPKSPSFSPKQYGAASLPQEEIEALLKIELTNHILGINIGSI